MSKQNDRSSYDDVLEKKNRGFVQIYKHHGELFAKVAKESPCGMSVLWFFIQHMGTYNNALMVSYKALQEKLGYSRASLANGIKYLQENRFIEIVKVGQANAYLINEQVAWEQTADKRQYATFKATIVATSSENKELADKYNKGLSRKLRRIPHYAEFIEHLDPHFKDTRKD